MVKGNVTVTTISRDPSSNTQTLAFDFVHRRAIFTRIFGTFHADLGPKEGLAQVVPH